MSCMPNISHACQDRLATHQPLVGAYHRALLDRIALSIADLREVVKQMTPAEALSLAVDDLLPLYQQFTALQDEALRK